MIIQRFCDVKVQVRSTGWQVCELSLRSTGGFYTLQMYGSIVWVRVRPYRRFIMCLNCRLSHAYVELSMHVLAASTHTNIYEYDEACPRMKFTTCIDNTQVYTSST